MKKLRYATIAALLLAAPLIMGQGVVKKAWNSYTNLSGANIAADDEWLIWDTSVGDLRNVLHSTLLTKLSENFSPREREFMALTSGSTTLDSSHLGKVIVNTDATEDVAAVLPECAAATEGYTYHLRVIDTTYTMTADPNVANTIRMAGSAAALSAGQAIVSPLTFGSWVILTCQDLGSADYDWIAHDDGTWEAESE